MGISFTNGIIILLVSFLIVVIAQENYTEREKALLDEFRQDVKSNLKKEYMKTDAYLIKWLRAKNYSLKDSKEMFEKALKWREENRIDQILNEDLSQFYNKVPYNLNSIDNQGRPVLTFNPGRWDIRRFILNGDTKYLKRFLDQMTERLQMTVNKIGRNVTQGVIILDIDGYNIRQHGCLQCIEPLLGWIRNYENYYPGLLAGFHLINTPRIFSPLLEFVKPLFSEPTAKVLKVYGPNKSEWSREILKIIPANQLTPQYGGTKRQ